MSFFGDFVGGAAEAGSGIIGRQIQKDQDVQASNQIADHQDQLATKRAIMMEDLKRDRAKKDGQAISDGADQMRQQRISDQIGGQSGTPLTEEQAKTIAASPEALKASGIVDRTRAGLMDDQISVAQKLGLEDHVKNLRGQQDVELRRDSEERRANTDERHWDVTQENYKASNAESIRHNKAVEANQAAMRSASEKLSPSAKAQLEMASEVMVSAGRAESAAVMAYKTASATMDPQQIAAAKADIDSARAGVAQAQSRYNAIGKAHLTEWKDVDAVSASPTKADAAAADAAAAVATGRISMADANKRLTAAGFKPLAAPEESKKSTEAAPAKDQETKTVKPANESGPSYAKWMAAKERKDEINSAASKMSPDKKAAYLQSRMPQVDAEIEANKNYRTY
jgi:hypothetical protein